MTSAPRFLIVLANAAVIGCSDRGEMPAPAPQPAESTLSAAEQAQAIASDPRMLLFDLETALEADHEAGGAYPTTADFQLEERWDLQRAALDAAFSSWEYVSDGTGYRLTGISEGRRFGIESPS